MGRSVFTDTSTNVGAKENFYPRLSLKFFFKKILLTLKYLSIQLRVLSNKVSVLVGKSERLGFSF